MRVRAAEVAHAAAIATLEAQLFPGEEWSAAQVAEELTGYGRRGWVLAATSTTGEESSTVVEAASGAPDELVGYVIMRTVGDVSDLQRIGVVASEQRAGLASRLIAAAIVGVREQGAERVLLEVAEDNTAARALYARHGFVEIDRRPRYYRTGADALVLELDLG